MDFLTLISQEDAKSLYAMLASLLVPFMVAILKDNQWDKRAKLALAIVTSLFGSLLSIWAAGSPMSGGTLIGTALLILAASQAHYATWFSSLGIDKTFNPPKPAPVPPDL
jgi:multidrug efflux pump subunit AcrB